jgi:hypothetical protein
MPIFDEQTCADVAKTLTAMCFRNTEIEDIHAGKGVITKTGDYSDVKVIDADGNEFTWQEASRISDPEMKMLVKGFVNRLYTFFMQVDDLRFNKNVNFHSLCTSKWDHPEIDPALDCTKEKTFIPD